MYRITEGVAWWRNEGLLDIYIYIYMEKMQQQQKQKEEEGKKRD